LPSIRPAIMAMGSSVMVYPSGLVLRAVAIAPDRPSPMEKHLGKSIWGKASAAHAGLYCIFMTQAGRPAKAID
jgi:hypothetical protein